MKQTVLPVGGHALPTWGSPGTSLGHLRAAPHIGPPASGAAHSETVCGHCWPNKKLVRRTANKRIGGSALYGLPGGVTGAGWWRFGLFGWLADWLGLQVGGLVRWWAPGWAV